VASSTLTAPSEATPSSASASDPRFVAAVPRPAPRVRVTVTEARPASDTPEAGDVVIQEAVVDAVQATAVEARLVTVTVAAVVVPSAHDTLTVAGDACSGGETVNTSGSSNSSPPVIPKASSAE